MTLVLIVVERDLDFELAANRNGKSSKWFGKLEREL